MLKLIFDFFFFFKRRDQILTVEIFFFCVALLYFFFFSYLKHSTCSNEIGSLSRRRCRAEPRKSVRTSITRSKADRDSSSCDATRERITLTAWRRDSLLHGADAGTLAGELLASATFRIGDAYVAGFASLQNCFVIFFHSRALSRIANPEAFLVVRNGRDGCWRWGFGLGMAADGQNGGAVEDTWVHLRRRRSQTSVNDFIF